MYDCKLGENNKNETSNARVELSRNVEEEPSAAAVGGGIKNKVWAQATSDISGKTQIVRQKTVGASYGDAFLAAYAVGDIKIDAIRDWNPVEYEFNPRLEYATLYKDKFKIFRELYVRNSDLMR